MDIVINIFGVNYSAGLVLLSIIIAILSAFVAFGIVGRVTTNKRSNMDRALWIVGGGLAMGSGIWCMHFIGMLAMQMPYPIFYSMKLTTLSLLLAVFFSSLSFMLVQSSLFKTVDLIFGSFLLGSGVAAMHFVGMAAIQWPIEISYDFTLVFVSLAIAFLAAAFVLKEFVRFKHLPLLKGISGKVVAAVVMGLGHCCPVKHV